MRSRSAFATAQWASSQPWRRPCAGTGTTGAASGRAAERALRVPGRPRCRSREGAEAVGQHIPAELPHQVLAHLRGIARPAGGPAAGRAAQRGGPAAGERAGQQRRVGLVLGVRLRIAAALHALGGHTVSGSRE